MALWYSSIFCCFHGPWLGRLREEHRVRWPALRRVAIRGNPRSCRRSNPLRGAVHPPEEESGLPSVAADGSALPRPWWEERFARHVIRSAAATSADVGVSGSFSSGTGPRSG